MSVGGNSRLYICDLDWVVVSGWITQPGQCGFRTAVLYRYLLSTLNSACKNMPRRTVPISPSYPFVGLLTECCALHNKRQRLSPGPSKSRLSPGDPKRRWLGFSLPVEFAVLSSWNGHTWLDVHLITNWLPWPSYIRSPERMDWHRGILYSRGIDLTQAHHVHTYSPSTVDIVWNKHVS